MRLKILSYNIHKAVGLDGRRDPARILGVINATGADIAVLQEADKRLGARPSAVPRFLIRQETDFVAADLARNDVSLGWHGNAVLVRRGLEIRQTRHIDLPALEPRGAVLLDVAGITLVGTHLGLLRTWRHRQMHRIARALAGRERHALIAGDFNEWSTRLGFEPWTDDFTLVRPGRSFHTARPVGELDRMAHGAGIRVTAIGVHRSGSARVASDHLPVWADIEVL